MLNDATGFKRAFIKIGYTDLRRGIDGLAAMIQQEFQMDPFEEGTLFMFCGRRTDRIKILTYEGDGFLLMYNRLADGQFRWPRSESEVREISAQQYRWLMDGLEITQKKVIKQVKPKHAV